MDISKYRGPGGRGSRTMRGGRGEKSQRYNKKREPSIHMEKPNTMSIEIVDNTLSSLQKQFFLSKFPSENVKLSYETVAPKKVSSTEYDLCLAIPFGKKAYIWFTYYYTTPICLLLELNRDNNISDNIVILSCKIPMDLELGTIISGTIYEKETDSDLPIDTEAVVEKIFLLDDIHLHKGISVSKFVFREKTGFIYDFLLQISTTVFSTNFTIKLPVLWNSEQPMPTDIPYNIRHIQHRSTFKIIPHLNVTTTRKPVWAPNILADSTIYMKDYRFDYSKPIYRKNAFFYVKADIAYDVYYLGSVDMNGDIQFFQHSLIMNYKTSILLNSLFRKIRENLCLDSIEESDDESDFENIREDKYVDLEKQILMECTFHSKFKRWMPISVSTTIGKPTLLSSLL
jgi:hypothetical protein